MTTVQNIVAKFNQKVDRFDLELILSHVLKRPREFVLAHPEAKINQKQEEKIKNYAARRAKHEPLAYILGHKEFYGLDFKVTKDTLIPRPETEMLVEQGTFLLRSMLRSKSRGNAAVIDIGTGSGNIIISLVKNFYTHCHSRENGNPVTNPKVSTLDSRLRGNDNHIFIATDISQRALSVARHNAKKHNVEKKIKFTQSDLLSAFIPNTKYQILNTNLIILANLPYLSKKIYNGAMPDVKNFEPKSSLYSGKEGLAHYEKLFTQIKKLKAKSYQLKAILEFSPEQKPKIAKLTKKYFSSAKVEFKKDLAGKWRLVSLKV